MRTQGPRSVVQERRAGPQEDRIKTDGRGASTIDEGGEGVKPPPAKVIVTPMSILWDPLLAQAMARELDRTFRGSRVRSLLMDAETRRVVLYLRESTLTFEMHPEAGWISSLPPAPPPPEARPLPAKVREIRSLADESALLLDLPRVRGSEEGVELLLEYPGNRWNALLIGHRSRRILQVLIPRPGGSRPLVVGEIWRPLAGKVRPGAPGTPPLTREVFEARVAEGPAALTRGVAGASSLTVARLSEADGWDFYRRGLDPEAWGSWITLTPRGPLVYPLPLASQAQPFPSLLEAMASHRASALAEGAEGADPGRADALLLSPALLVRARQRQEGLLRRLRALERELAGAPDPAPVRALGDLLLARFHEVPKGADRVRLEDFDGEWVEISLNPALPVQANARLYYDRAGRAERARRELPARIARAQEALDTFLALLDGVMDGSLPPEALPAHLAKGADSAPKSPGGRSELEGAPLPYWRFRSSGGHEIRVGRDARKNDDLTFRHAGPEDIWLHVREAPGAHVVLRWGRKDSPPPRDLEEAAILAALNSEARHAGIVPVDWTRRKHVRKPRKAPPGAVVPERVQTLFVEPDPALPARLRTAEEGSASG
jgi:hypothetical protein